MKCPQCKKKLKWETIHTGWRWADGKEIVIEARSCRCGYKKGTFK